MNKLPLEKVFSTYEKDFTELVHAIMLPYNGTPYVFSSNDINYLTHFVENIIDDEVFDIVFEQEDIEQELRCIWVRFYKQYYTNKIQSVSLRRYLIRRSVWELRDWLVKQCHVVTKQYYVPYTDFSITSDLNLNASFLLDRNSTVGSLLTPYQRYIIYLKFGCEQNVCSIAKHLAQDRHMISKQLNKTLQILRR